MQLDSTAQILSNQKTYGLWGLYTVPARSSGLVEGEPTRLTHAGRSFVERVCDELAFVEDGVEKHDPLDHPSRSSPAALQSAAVDSEGGNHCL